MRYYPIHIILKELAFWIPFFLIEKFSAHQDYFFRTEWLTRTIKESIGASIYISLGFIIINLLVFTALYFFLKKIAFRPKAFSFGVLLHFFSLLLILISVSLEGRALNYILSAGISLVVSGYIYKKLNEVSSLEELARKCFGLK